MDERSIFDSVLRDERAYSQLLCNLLREFDSFREKVISLLISEEIVGIDPEDIQAEQVLGDACGRPDIVIRSNDYCIYIEVKVAQDRDTTECQELSSEIQPHTYQYSLSKEKAKHKHLVFLVPRNWKSQVRIDHLKTTLRQQGVDLAIKHWDEVANLLKSYEAIGTVIVKEFGKLLSSEFQPLHFNKEEIQMIFSEDFQSTYLAVRKLEHVVDKVLQKAEQFRTIQGANWVRPRIERTESEYGLYFRNRDNKECLWFGIWPDASTRIKSPICIAVQNTWGRQIPDLLDDFRANWNRPAVDFKKWTISDFDGEVFRKEDAAGEIWSKLMPLLTQLTN